MTNTIEKTRELLQNHLNEIDGERSQIERAISALGGSPKPAPSAVSGKRKSPARRRKVKRAPRGQRKAELLAALNESPGASATKLASAMKISANQVHGLLRSARDEGTVTKHGSGYSVAE